ncbi:Baculoviral inhibition of apoptosis protein repeat domain-containing protein [Aphelenchoides besseyi]|nr:Baculoviral inhibition of apoptosis protein repeat domain-containing protein [Aphelenchoides besseyi]KAI6193217.1 Baculoviral inhibition of apoptosis protein repeat domain-containing protein [Aphelenchoides besseyi]
MAQHLYPMLLHKTALALPAYLESWVSVESRSKTFNQWPYDDFVGAECTSEKLALTGFKMTHGGDNPSAKCVCCEKEMIFDPEDVPHDEHTKHSPNCFYVTEGPDDSNSEMNVRRALKAIAWKGALNEYADIATMTEQVSEAADNARQRLAMLFLDVEKQIHDE